MAKGFLITLEGGEGTGKTSVIRPLASHVKKLGLPVTILREPGGTRISDSIRTILTDHGNYEMINLAELLLFQASRAQLVHEQVRPLLDSGYVVLMDRFRDSSLAYQGYARGEGCGRMDRLNEWVTASLQPDFTILFDLSVEIGLDRKRQQGEFNRLDACDKKFYEDVRYAYLQLAHFENAYSLGPNRWEIIDASKDLQSVTMEAKILVEQRLVWAGMVEGGRNGVEYA